MISRIPSHHSRREGPAITTTVADDRDYRCGGGSRTAMVFAWIAGFIEGG
jgi:hypothetical protein